MNTSIGICVINALTSFENLQFSKRREISLNMCLISSAIIKIPRKVIICHNKSTNNSPMVQPQFFLKQNVKGRAAAVVPSRHLQHIVPHQSDKTIH